jgi:hypothetical protein
LAAYQAIDVVNTTRIPAFEDKLDTATVVVDVDPAPYIGPVAVQRDRLAVQ